MKSKNYKNVKFKVIFFIGPPGSGKDTQGKILAKKLKGKFISVSYLLKHFLTKNKKKYFKINNKLYNLKEELNKLISGDLIDSNLVIFVLFKKISEIFNNKQNILIISGSPRKLIEAKKEFYFLNKFLSGKFIFIFLYISQKEIYKRLLRRKREDDTFEIIKIRIENYKKETLPAINFLLTKGVLIKINGEGKVKTIHQRIMRKLLSLT